MIIERTLLEILSDIDQTDFNIVDLKVAIASSWRDIDPLSVGNYLESSLSDKERSKLGSYYTQKDDIMFIIEPVLMSPFKRKWQSIKEKAKQECNIKDMCNSILEEIRNITVLDPACGSGNFLSVALKALLDMEHEIIDLASTLGLECDIPSVSPLQLFGIDIDSNACMLTKFVVMLSYAQWLDEHSYNNMINSIDSTLKKSVSENIVCKDAIIAYDSEGNPIMPGWGYADIIIGNPPFLGGKKMRRELSDEYVEALRELYDGRVPGGADLVTYWYECAREQIEQGRTKRVGLLATNSIRGGANRKVLERIKETGDIFMAWQDREWVLEGAAVRVSMVGFDDGSEEAKRLDGEDVGQINADLTSSVDITKAKQLESHDLAFIGTQKGGAFDIKEDLAKEMIATDAKNARVVKQWMNASDVTKKSRNKWVINFQEMTLEEAKKYERPLEYVRKNVKPKRDKNRDKRSRKYWWLFQRSRPAMYSALEGLNRYIATPMTAKHRMFVFLDINVVPENLLVVIARDDDYFFGVLHSRLHERWSLRMGTSLEDRPRYTPTTTFETFPFPYVPGSEEKESLEYKTIAFAAKQLYEERQLWLNGYDSDVIPDLAKDEGVPDTKNISEGELESRTLTNIYNSLSVLRGEESIIVESLAKDFAPRLVYLHENLDKAVCKAYGFDYSDLHDENKVLSFLLDLNIKRSGEGET